MMATQRERGYATRIGGTTNERELTQMDQELRTGSGIVDDVDRHDGSRRFRTRTIIAGMVILLAAGLVVEQVGAAPGTPPRPVSKWSSFQPSLAPKPAPPAPSGASGNGAAGLTAPVVPSGDSRNICAELLEDRAQRLAQADARIAAAGTAAEVARLQQARAQILNSFNRELARFSCAFSG
jgi:hypothetical protein